MQISLRLSLIYHNLLYNFRINIMYIKYYINTCRLLLCVGKTLTNSDGRPKSRTAINKTERLKGAVLETNPETTLNQLPQLLQDMITEVISSNCGKQVSRITFEALD